MAQQQAKSSAGNTILIWLSVAILIASLVGFVLAPDYVPGISMLYRALGLIVGSLVAVFVFSRSATGQLVWDYIVTSRVEIRKMVWPTRQETAQTTLMVLIMVLILAVMLWLMDMVLIEGVAFITGRGEV